MATRRNTVPVLMFLLGCVSVAFIFYVLDSRIGLSNVFKKDQELQIIAERLEQLTEGQAHLREEIEALKEQNLETDRDEEGSQKHSSVPQCDPSPCDASEFSNTEWRLRYSYSGLSQGSLILRSDKNVEMTIGGDIGRSNTCRGAWWMNGRELHFRCGTQKFKGTLENDVLKGKYHDTN